MGASFTHVSVNNADGIFVMSVAGRVRLTVGEPAPELGIRLRAPEGVFEVENTVQLDLGEDARPYGDKVGVLFASGMAIPVIPGLFEIYLALNGVEVRRLAFDMVIDD